MQIHTIWHAKLHPLTIICIIIKLDESLTTYERSGINSSCCFQTYAATYDC